MSTVSVYFNKEQEAWLKERELVAAPWVKELVSRAMSEEVPEPQPDVRAVPAPPHVPLGPPRLQRRKVCPECRRPF
jgi:hypothetical protein